jgi:hypothetical protein
MQENCAMTMYHKHLNRALLVSALVGILLLALAPLASAAVPPASLSPREISDLQFMREEEKLARDVYQTLYTAWRVPVFTNIAGSEQTHMDSILTLLNRYEIDDPAAGNGVGEFTNPDLQALYDRLVSQGRQSLVEALRVGTTIEEIDIRDLDEAIAATTHADISRVYQSLKRGSENHLRAFVRTLERETDGTFIPLYLDQATYDTIMAARPGGFGAGRSGSGRNRQGR